MQVITEVPVTTTYAMTFVLGKSDADLQIDSVRVLFTLQCGASTAGCDLRDRTASWVSLVGLDIEAAPSNYKHEGASEDLLQKFRPTGRVVKDLVAAASSTSFRALLELV